MARKSQDRKAAGRKPAGRNSADRQSAGRTAKKSSSQGQRSARRASQGGGSDERKSGYRQKVDAGKLAQAAKKDGCLPKLFMLLLPLAAMGMYLYLRA
jgi:hypothetical protein